MSRKLAQGFTLVELLVVIVIIGLLAALLLPALSKAMCNGRMGACEHLIDNLAQATKSYELDCNGFPPDAAGNATSSLVQALNSPGPKKLSYFEFPPDMLSGTAPNASIRNPVRATTETLSYRNNAVNAADATAHNKATFDIWAKDCNNIVDGCNNWE
jgi:prepilin-type N-terminal cleavage/methylation domain-containing protein